MTSRASTPRAEPIAVIGVACRLPGAPDLAAYWTLLDEGRHAIAEPSARRRADSAVPGGTDELPPGGYLDRVDAFDAAFFGISPREADTLDPHQRLALELGWEALENASLPIDPLRGSATGVFVGATSHDWATVVHRHAVRDVTRHTFTGTARALIANRLSWALGVNGASVTVDTAQSSSLVAVHQACESLRSGESSLALAGGVHLNLAQESTIGAERFGALSPDHRCYTFDVRANGFVRGEGGAFVVLKPLRAARADGDRVIGVIHGSAVTADGHTDGLTVPSATAQAAALRRATERAGVDPDAVQYVELHGTGTKVGDPVEAEALGTVFGGRAGDDPLVVGSVKTNIGHLEGASGIAGLVKVLLALDRRALPPSLHHETPNPAVDLTGRRLRVQTESSPWPRPDRPLLAGVSSFGMGGTNCHVIVGESEGAADAPLGAEAAVPAGTGAKDRPRLFARTDTHAWPVSARTADALAGQAARLRDHLTGATGATGTSGSEAAAEEATPGDLAYSLAATRTHGAHRAVVVGSSTDELAAGLAGLATGIPPRSVASGVAHGVRPVVLVFPGQGSQWTGMAAELLDTSPVFAAHMAACAAALAPHVDWDLEAVLRQRPGAPDLERVDVVQPALFSVMVSLARLWEALGVRPAAVIGHSQGEIAAAHVAGALTLEAAAAIVARRSRLIRELLVGSGGMASVPRPADEVRERIGDAADLLGVAAVNGPGVTVVSGERDALDALLAGYRAENADVRVIPVDYASHSPRVEPLREALARELADLPPSDGGGVAFYSTVTGGRFDPRGLDAAYWYRNLRDTVRFDDAVRAALADGHRLFVEASPHPVLTYGLRQIQDAAGAPDAAAIGTLRRGEGGPVRLLTSAGEAFAHGAPVDWSATHGPDARRVDLPTYAFRRRRHWIDARQDAAADSAVEHSAHPDHAKAPVPVAEAGGTAPGSAGNRAARDALALVRATAAVILGHPGPASVDPDTTFKDLGFDSLGAVEFRDRLAAASGAHLPASLTFDHPTPRAVARVLEGVTAGTVADADPDARGGSRPRPRQAPTGVPPSTPATPWSSSRPRAGGPVAPTPRRRCGTSSTPEPTPSAPSRTTADGTSTRCTTPTSRGRVPPTCARADSCTAPTASTRRSSASAPVRRPPWTRSSACCWKPRGRRSNAPEYSPNHCAGHGPGCSSGPCRRTTARACTRHRKGTRATC